MYVLDYNWKLKSAHSIFYDVASSTDIFYHNCNVMLPEVQITAELLCWSHLCDSHWILWLSVLTGLAFLAGP